MSNKWGSGLRRLAVTAAVVAAAAVTAGGAAQAAAASTTSGAERSVAANQLQQEIRTFADKCLTVRNQSPNNSVPIDQFQCQNDFAQRFSLVAPL